MDNNKKKVVVDFKKVKMSSRTEMWTDDMSRSMFLQSDGKVTEPVKPFTEPLHITSRKSRTAKFQNKFR